MELSIIIPVYNVEKYLDKCLSSAVDNLSNTDELILVDDGSTDTSSLKCDAWAKKDSRIRVFHKENGGLMSAWKYGVIHADGKYIGFIDSDDWIETEMYSSMLNLAEKYNADIVCSGLVKEYSDGTSEKEIINFEEGAYSQERLQKEIFPRMIYDSKTHNRGFSPNKVTKIFTKEILMSVLELCDQKVSIGEDLLTSFACFSKAKCIYFMKDHFPYHYRINNSSMIMQYSDSKYEKIKALRQAMLRVNETCSYDFGWQIHNDYISLILGQLDQEMLFSKKRKKEIYSSMSQIDNSKEFRVSLENGDKGNLSWKNKIYIALMKRAKWLLLFIRKMKSAKE